MHISFGHGTWSHLDAGLHLIWALELISFGCGTHIALGPVPNLCLHSESSSFSKYRGATDHSNCQKKPGPNLIWAWGRITFDQLWIMCVVLAYWHPYTYKVGAYLLCSRWSHSSIQDPSTLGPQDSLVIQDPTKWPWPSRRDTSNHAVIPTPPIWVNRMACGHVYET